MSLGWTSMQRDRQPEVMDQPGLDPADHDRALQGLRRINGISRCVPGLFRHFETLASETPSTQLSVLELACGGGDTAIALAALARRRHLNLSFQACDLNPEAVRIAQRNAAKSESSVRVFVEDALEPSRSQQFDVVYCTLFVHHLDPPDVMRLLRGMAARARRLVIVDDLIRSRLGYSLAWIGTRLLSRSWVVHHDGPLSVQAAFTPKEILDLAAQAGLRDCALERTWPERYRLCWKPH
ncbi:class I SAM-dependent methyltransferase [Synechococcus sp. MIT S1220]|uniref:class I SAM-dependent methyltransferase n=1 Tax=Synechococcus sp. MIT S1220 TaxID=3082549 RepID=UPI0039AEA47D